MTPEALAFLFLMFLIFVAIASVVWPWHESGDMVDEVTEEWQPADLSRGDFQ